MKKTLDASQGISIFMMDLKLYVNQSHIQTKFCYFNINQRNHKLKTKVFMKYVKILIVFLFHRHHSTL